MEQYQLAKDSPIFNGPLVSADGKLVFLVPAIQVTAEELMKLFPTFIGNDDILKIEPRKFRGDI